MYNLWCFFLNTHTWLTKNSLFRHVNKKEEQSNSLNDDWFVKTNLWVAVIGILGLLCPVFLPSVSEECINTVKLYLLDSRCTSDSILTLLTVGTGVTGPLVGEDFGIYRPMYSKFEGGWIINCPNPLYIQMKAFGSSGSGHYSSSQEI